MAISGTEVQKLYIAYFGRPMDPAGATYYSEHAEDIMQVARWFSVSSESQALYGDKSASDLVAAIYENIFGRVPEAAGLLYWSQQIVAGTLSAAEAAVHIMAAAQGSDASTIENKLVAAQAFTDALDTNAELKGYSGLTSAATARAFLSKVTDSAASIADLDRIVTKAVADATGTGTVDTGTGGGGGGTPPFSATLAGGTVTFTSPGTEISVSQSADTYTFTSSGGSAGTATITTTSLASITVPTGTTLVVERTHADSLTFTGAGTLKVSDSGSISATDINTLDAHVAGLLDVSDYVDVSGSLADLTTVFVTNQGTSGNKVKTAADVAVQISGTTSASAADLKAIEAATTGFVNAAAITTLTGSISDAKLLLVTNNGSSGDKISTATNVVVNLSDTGTVAAADLNDINAATTGLITASSITGLSGSSADITTALSAIRLGTTLNATGLTEVNVIGTSNFGFSGGFHGDITITLDDAANNYVATSSGSIASGRTLTVDGSAMTGSNSMTFNVSSLSSSTHIGIGGAGNDSFRGGLGVDTFYGGAGNDVIKGQDGNDVLNGDDGNDELRGGEGNDTINGGAGDDYIDGGNGADVLTGGAGADTFHYFEPMEGGDTITDFDSDDRVLVSELDFPGYGALSVISGNGAYNDSYSPDGSGILMLYTDTSTSTTQLIADYNGNGGGYSYVVVTFTGIVSVRPDQIQFTDYS